MISAKEDLLQELRTILVGLPTVEEVNPEKYKDELDGWVNDSVNRWKGKLEEQNVEPHDSARCAKGYWIAAYMVEAPTKLPKGLTQLRQLLSTIQGPETGLPPWVVSTHPEIMPKPYRDTIEAWFKPGLISFPSLSDFWRVSQDGKLFILRGYQEDDDEGRKDPILLANSPVWLSGECLLHAKRFAEAVGSEDSVLHFVMQWRGLKGRELVTIGVPIRLRHRSQQSAVTSRVSVTPRTISAALPEVVAELLLPLYERFDFYSPLPGFIERELAEMRRTVIR